MTLRAVHGEQRRWPLSERIVDENLGSYQHVPCSRERPTSTTAEAVVPEARTADFAEDHDDEHPQRNDASSADHDAELMDAVWLYEWSHAALRSGLV